MSRMVRKQVYIEPSQEELLKQQARELGVTESEVIRRGIDQVGRVVTGLPLDQAAWQDELAFIRERARLQSQGRTRRWTREELYADRLKRFSH